MDPCDLLVEQGPEPFKKALSNAVDALDFKLKQLLTSEDVHSLEGTRNVIDSILGIMALAPELPGQAAKVKQELIVSRIAHRLSLRQETIWARFGELKREAASKRDSTSTPVTRPAPVEQPSGPKAGPAPPLERQLVEILLAEPNFVATAMEEIPLEEISHPGLRKLLAGLYEMRSRNEVPELDGLRLILTQPELVRAAIRFQETGRGIPERSQWFERILERFREQRIEREKKNLAERLNSVSDHQAALELLRQLQNPTVGSDS
jgi:DNA primase